MATVIEVQNPEALGLPWLQDLIAAGLSGHKVYHPLPFLRSLQHGLAAQTLRLFVAREENEVAGSGYAVIAAPTFILPAWAVLHLYAHPDKRDILDALLTTCASVGPTVVYYNWHPKRKHKVKRMLRRVGQYSHACELYVLSPTPAST